MYELLNHINGIQSLARSRTIDLSEPIEPYLEIAAEMEKINESRFITRALFIREQVNGNLGKEIFDQYCDDWDIWEFPEEILTVEDFKRGFLWKFRDHTTSWMANDKAKGWFLTSPEALFVRRYEFWSCDNGFDKCIEVREGDYKTILESLLRDGDYKVLCSSVFSKVELDEFIKSYNPKTDALPIEEIIEEYIICNPNFKE